MISLRDFIAASTRSLLGTSLKLKNLMSFQDANGNEKFMATTQFEGWFCTQRKYRLSNHIY